MTTVVDVTMPTGVRFGIGDIASPLRYTDYFLPNSEEATRLTGREDERSAARCLSDLNHRLRRRDHSRAGGPRRSASSSFC